MKKVLVFGTFDVLHPGHLHMLAQAREYGDMLTVVVARDATVEKLKGAAPLFSESERAAHLSALEVVDNVLLGNIDDKYAVVHETNPDVICLGYDQHAFTEKLEGIATKLGARIIRLDSFSPDKHKSSHHKKDMFGGIIVHGRKEGRAIGYPTANIEVATISHAPGIYAASVWIEEVLHPAVAIIGAREESGAPLVEVHIFDFNDDIYGQRVVVRLEYKVRDMESFDTTEKLIARIKKDIAYVHRNSSKCWDH